MATLKIAKNALSAEEIAIRTGKPLAEVERIIALAKKAMTPVMRQIAVREGGEEHSYNVTRVGIGPIATEFGNFYHVVFQINDRWKIYHVLVRCESFDDEWNPVFQNPKRILVRTDSGCLTGQVFHDQTCECREQLHRAMKEISTHGEGIIVHIPRQDGRGKGLHFKLGTLFLQEQLGLDTVESATLLSGDGVIEARTYSGVSAVLRFFGLGAGVTINLVTNNPHKLRVLSENGYAVDRTSIIVAPTEHTARHLAAKEAHLGHLQLVTGKGDDSKQE